MRPDFITSLLFDEVPNLNFSKSWMSLIGDFKNYRKSEKWKKSAMTKMIGTSKVINSIIHEDAIIGDFALIRNSIISKDVLIGAHCQINSSIVMENSNFPHFNNVGYSFIGKNVLFGASTVTTSIRLDGKQPSILIEKDKLEALSDKFGVLIGDNVKIGSLVVLNPMTILEKEIKIKPNVSVSGVVRKGDRCCIPV